MAELKGTNVAAGIVPFTSDDKYATHDAEYGKGGFRSVATIAARDAIPTERKTNGMVVAVLSDGKNYAWSDGAWEEWLPKGNVTVDQSLNSTSTNAIANKAVSAKFTSVQTELAAVKEVANNAIPKTSIDQEIGVDNSQSQTTVPSSKAVYDVISASNSDLYNKITSVDATAKSAKSTAEAAIPKSKIAKEYSEIVITDTTQVPSSKAFNDAILDVAIILQAGIDEAQTNSEVATSIARGAIPKSNMAQDVAAMAESTIAVPSTKAVHDAITSAVNGIPKITVDAALSTTSVNPLQNKVVTAKFTEVTTGMQLLRDYINATIEDLGNVSSDVTTNHNAITDINTKLTPINTAWGKKNAANGLVQLDGSAKLPANVLPAGYDNIDMLVAFIAANPTTGMTIGQKWYVTSTKLIFTATSATSGSTTMPEGDEKIYINTQLNKSYRWTGSDMVVVGDGSGIALGTTASTAFRGDFGNTLYTNFGSGTNLTNTQAARNFFGDTNSDTYIKDISNLTRSADKVEFSYSRRKYKDLSSTSNSGISILSANETQAGVMTAAMFKTLQELELQAFPLVLTLSGAGVFEVGKSTRTPINISVTRKGEAITGSAALVVTPPSGITGILGEGYRTWTPSVDIRTNSTISIKATFGAQTQTKSISYTFKYKKYWGVSTQASLNNADILALANNTWADSRAMNATNFDCSGGKYPYYVIPASIYIGLEVWVGGLKNTDLVVTDMTVVNASGASAAYKVIRLANKQTGNLSIQFK